jgi:uncharacterized protein involved in exopolysaccharide biosynthesis
MIATDITPTTQATDLREKWLSYWRCRRTFAVVTAVAAIATILLALLLPSTYQSTGTILIEQQEIPQDMVRSVITSFADERVQMISQRVMTTQNLLSLIERYDLYPDIRAKQPREILLQKFHDDIGMHMISADVIDPRSGRPTQATIAFAVSYKSRSPDLALKVANELTTLYLNQNLISRTQSAQQSESFLKEEAQKLAERIAQLDSQLAKFKEAHHDDLPELEQLNVQEMQRTELDLRDAESRIAALESQRVLLEAQLAQISPNSQVYSDSGQRVFGPEDRLKALKSQLASYKAKYGPTHPDVISTQREVDGLEKEVTAEDQTDDRLKQLSEARAQLASALQKYSQQHPDVIRLKATVDSLEKAVAEEDGAAPKRIAKDHADNPVYIQVKGQLDATEVERQSAVQKRDALRARLDKYERRSAEEPEVERQYQTMARDLQSAQLKYQEMLSKQSEAQVSENLETERKGEKFTLIEPPQPPEKPISPNRPLILGLGLFLSAAVGAGAVLVRDALDTTIRGPADIRLMLRVPALASIPVIVNAADRRRRRRMLSLSWGGGFAVLLTVILCVHFFVKPLDVLWASLLRRFGV